MRGGARVRMSRVLGLLVMVLVSCNTPSNKAAAPPRDAAPGVKAEAPRPPQPPAAPVLEAREIALDDGKVKVKAKIPSGFTASGGSTTFWSPVEATSIIRPSVQIDHTCGGVCSAENVATVLAKLVNDAKASAARPNLNTGDPKLDAMRMDVTVLEEGKLPGSGPFVALRVTRGAGWEGPNLDQLLAVCAVAGADYVVITQARIGLVDEKPLWPLLVESCKATAIE